MVGDARARRGRPVMPKLEALGAVASSLLLISAGTGSAQPAPPPVAWTTPTDPQIRAILAERIDVQHRGVGIVVGVIDAHGRRIVSYGARDQGDPRPLD